MMMLIEIMVLPLIWTLVDTDPDYHADSDTDSDNDYPSLINIFLLIRNIFSDSNSEHRWDSDSDSDYFARVW